MAFIVLFFLLLHRFTRAFDSAAMLAYTSMNDVEDLCLMKVRIGKKNDEVCALV
jgi:hypothetical protein